MLDENKEPLITQWGEVKLKWGQFEIRTYDEYPKPFPLYPGEEVYGSIEKYTYVNASSGLHLVAVEDFTDTVKGKPVKRVAGEEWSIDGPFTYVPRTEVEVVKTINGIVIKQNQALKLEALRDFTDKTGIARRVAKKWLIRETGVYVPSCFEKSLGVEDMYILGEREALILEAIKNFTDTYGLVRKAGDQWLITPKRTPTHQLDVNERLVSIQDITVLSNRQYCIIKNPIDQHGQNQYGKRILKKGPESFFLNPGEELENNAINDVKVLGFDDSLLLEAEETFTEGKIQRIAGQKWSISGPCEYVPPIEVKIVQTRKLVQLTENEGIYVRNRKTGSVRTVLGESYMLNENEELWEKILPEKVEHLVAIQRIGKPYVPPKKRADGSWGFEKFEVKDYIRDKTKAVSYKVPHNTAIQLYDFKENTERVIFGPDIAFLGPYEEFTVLSLAAGRPKQPDMITTLTLGLGPDFMTDLIGCETADHARVWVDISYNWNFVYTKGDQKDGKAMFTVKDFVTHCCSYFGSKVRGAVSGVSFNELHRNSNAIVRAAVFGKDEKGVNKDGFYFEANRFFLSSMDVKKVTPMDESTKNLLTKATNLAFEISTKSYETKARHIAQKQQQDAEAQLSRQKLDDQATSEQSRIQLVKVEAINKSVQTCGHALAEAKGLAEMALVEARTEVDNAKYHAEAVTFELQCELDIMEMEHTLEYTSIRDKQNLEIKRLTAAADLEVQRIVKTMATMGQDTMIAIANAGPELKTQLLQALNLKGFLVSDGKNPINLFNSASGMITDGAKMN
jgi:major vault protein